MNFLVTVEKLGVNMVLQKNITIQMLDKNLVELQVKES